LSEAYYELVELLGEGGMGRVHRAIHYPTGAEVAIKTLRGEPDAMRRRLLLDEATAAARVRDRRVARVMDVGREPDGSPFLVMELVPGHDFERYFQAWPGWPTVARGLGEILEGLRAAHAVSVVHRDLKPPNVLIDGRDQGIRLVDFGIAAVLDPIDEEGERPIAGTPEFMAPEQLTGEGPVGPFTDLYAFGVMLCHIVRGGSPFGQLDDLTRLLAEKRAYLPGVDRRSRPGLAVPERLQQLIDRLLEPRPRSRERFAERARIELEAVAGEVAESVYEDAPLPYRSAQTSIDPSFEATGLASASQLLSSDETVADPTDLRRRLPAPLDPRTAISVFSVRDAPISGRNKEREELLRVIDHVAASGGARLVTYVGEPGIGKSRLARFGLEEVERRGLMEGAATGFDPRGADVSGGLFRLLSRWLGAPRDPRVEWAWIDQPGIDLHRMHRWLAGTSDESTDRPSIGEVVDITHAVLRALSRRAPIYLWFDDLAWARDGAIELASRVLAAQDTRVLLVATLRSGTLHHEATRVRLGPLFASPHAIIRQVEPLDSLERRALVRSLVPLAPHMIEELADRLDGSPMMIVEIVRALVAQDRLETAPEGLVPRGGGSIVELLGDRPLAGLVDSRIDALFAAFESDAGVAEGVLVRAALLGAFFEDRTLRACIHGDRVLTAAVDEVLDRALLHGIVRAEGASLFSFDHGLIQEALMLRLDRSPDRQRVFYDVANGLQALYGKDRADVAAAIADLMRRAGAKERAWDRLIHAIEASAWSGDRASAAAHLAVANDWLTIDDEPAMSLRRARVAYSQARAHYYALEYDASRISLSRALSIARVGKDDMLALSCEAFSSGVAFYQDRFAEAERIARACERRASLDDPDLARIGADAAHRLADLAVLKDDRAGAIEAWQRTVQFRLAAGEPWRTRLAKLNLGESVMIAGRLDEAGAILHAVRQDATAAQDEEGLSSCVDLEARLAYLRGDPEGARAAMVERARSIESTGDQWRLTMLTAFLALLSAELDDDEVATRAAARFVEAYTKVPHDEAFTILAMDALAGELEARGLGEPALRVRGVIEQRALRVKAGFER
jgi:serine/threonine protein kinase